MIRPQQSSGVAVQAQACKARQNDARKLVYCSLLARSADSDRQVAYANKQLTLQTRQSAWKAGVTTLACSLT